MKKISLCLVFVVLLLTLTGIPIGIASSSEGPKIGGFTMYQTEDGVAIRFLYFNVKGGMLMSSFDIGYIVRDRTGVKTGTGFENVKLTGAGIKDSLIETDETGEFKAFIPLSAVREQGLKSGDEIEYFIRLIDVNGVESNTVHYLFTLAESI